MLSTLTKKEYDERDAVRIVNPTQAAFYWGKWGIAPLSVYPSENFETGKPILVFIFSRSQTKDAYEAWCASRP